MGWHPSLDCVSASSINLVDSYVQQVLPQIEGGVRRGDGDEGVRATEGLNAKITTVSISPHPSFEKQPSNLAGVRPGGCHAAGATLPRRVSNPFQTRAIPKMGQVEMPQEGRTCWSAMRRLYKSNACWLHSAIVVLLGLFGVHKDHKHHDSNPCTD